MFAELATLVFAVIALRYSLHTIDQMLTFGATTFVLRVNKLWAEAAVPIGFVLITIRCVQAISRDVADIRAGRPAYQGKALFEEYARMAVPLTMLFWWSCSSSACRSGWGSGSAPSSCCSRPARCP